MADLLHRAFGFWWNSGARCASIGVVIADKDVCNAPALPQVQLDIVLC